MGEVGGNAAIVPQPQKENETRLHDIRKVGSEYHEVADDDDMDGRITKERPTYHIEPCGGNG